MGLGFCHFLGKLIELVDFLNAFVTLKTKKISKAPYEKFSAAVLNNQIA